MNREQSIELALKMTRDLISFFEINPEITHHIEDDVLNIEVEANEISSILIGRNAETLRAFQSIISSVLRTKEAEIYRISLDVADYKKHHAQKIAAKAEFWIEQVLETGQPKEVNLNAADRWTVHKIAQDYSEIQTHSEGEGRDRKLIISKK